MIDIDALRKTGAYLAADANETLIEELCAEIERLRDLDKLNKPFREELKTADVLMLRKNAEIERLREENDELRITAAFDEAQRDLKAGKLKPMSVDEIMAEIEKE